MLFPAGHAVQEDASADPGMDVNPARQSEQVPEPGDAAYFPAMHEEQADCPAKPFVDSPARHDVHDAEEIQE